MLIPSSVRAYSTGNRALLRITQSNDERRGMVRYPLRESGGCLRKLMVKQGSSLCLVSEYRVVSTVPYPRDPRYIVQSEIATALRCLLRDYIPSNSNPVVLWGVGTGWVLRLRYDYTADQRLPALGGQSQGLKLLICKSIEQRLPYRSQTKCERTIFQSFGYEPTGLYWIIAMY